jgi:hypothetical protein
MIGVSSSGFQSLSLLKQGCRDHNKGIYDAFPKRFEYSIIEFWFQVRRGLWYENLSIHIVY